MAKFQISSTFISVEKQKSVSLLNLYSKSLKFFYNHRVRWFLRSGPRTLATWTANDPGSGTNEPVRRSAHRTPNPTSMESTILDTLRGRHNGSIESSLRNRNFGAK